MNEYDNFKHTDLTAQIIKGAYYVHDYFGNGYLESVYEKSLAIKLRMEGLEVETQCPLQVFFEGELVGDFRADLLINDTVIVELKAVERFHPKHEVQLVNYLRSSEIEVGLLINFGEELEIKRRVFSNKRKKQLRRIK